MIAPDLVFDWFAGGGAVAVLASFSGALGVSAAIAACAPVNKAADKPAQTMDLRANLMVLLRDPATELSMCAGAAFPFATVLTVQGLHNPNKRTIGLTLRLAIAVRRPPAGQRYFAHANTSPIAGEDSGRPLDNDSWLSDVVSRGTVGLVNPSESRTRRTAGAIFPPRLRHKPQP